MVFTPADHFPGVTLTLLALLARVMTGFVTAPAAGAGVEKLSEEKRMATSPQIIRDLIAIPFTYLTVTLDVYVLPSIFTVTVFTPAVTV